MAPNDLSSPISGFMKMAILGTLAWMTCIVYSLIPGLYCGVITSTPHGLISVCLCCLVMLGSKASCICCSCFSSWFLGSDKLGIGIMITTSYTWLLQGLWAEWTVCTLSLFSCRKEVYTIYSGEIITHPGQAGSLSPTLFCHSHSLDEVLFRFKILKVFQNLPFFQCFSFKNPSSIQIFIHLFPSEQDEPSSAFHFFSSWMLCHLPNPITLSHQLL